jgi:hypothetical protein
LSHCTSLISVKCFFWDRVSKTTCQGWLRTNILLISASRVARITGVSHQCPANLMSRTFYHRTSQCIVCVCEQSLCHPWCMNSKTGCLLKAGEVWQGKWW